MIKINNGVVAASFFEKGAELCSLVLLASQTEYIWQAGEEWPKHSPILFPIVGTLKNGHFQHKGHCYSLSRHGFARDSIFQVLYKKEDEVAFSLLSNKNSLAIYPFMFELRVYYKLQGATLNVRYEVYNLDTDSLYFSLGAHPAFKVPIEEHLDFNDYHLTIEMPEEQALPIILYPLTAEGLTQMEGVPYLKSHREVIRLNPELFRKDAMVFKNLHSAVVRLESPLSDRKLAMQYTGFPYLGLWNTYGASFLCIEPWAGITDNEGATGILFEKEGINKLAPNEMWTASWMLIIE